METKFNFKCPICGEKVLKSKGIKLMWAMICERCFDEMINEE